MVVGLCKTFSVSLLAVTTFRRFNCTFSTNRTLAVCCGQYQNGLTTPLSCVINKRLLCSKGNLSVSSMAFLKRVFRSTNTDKTQSTSTQMNGEVEAVTEQTEDMSLQSTDYEAQFGSAPGIIRTRVGFTGGKKKGPTYYSLGDHTETVEIDYNPKETSYKELLKIFWENHDSTRCASRQYMSAIFYNNEEQKKLAEESKEAEQKRKSRQIQTRIVEAETFYNAEDYHQKYLLRQQKDVLGTLNLTEEQLITSTVACRLNGYCGGYGTVTALNEELPAMKLPAKIEDRLRRLASRGPN